MSEIIESENFAPYGGFIGSYPFSLEFITKKAEISGGKTLLTKETLIGLFD